MKKIEFKKFTIADCNAIMTIIDNISFNNGVYSPVNADFFSKVYIYFLTTNIIDEYVSKGEDGSISINDINKLYEYIYSSEILEIINSDEKSFEFQEIVNRYKDMADSMIDFHKQQIISDKHSLVEISLSNLIDNLNRIVESIDNPVTSDDVKKLIETKDDIIDKLVDSERLDKRLREHEERNKKLKEQAEKIEKMKTVMKKREPKFEK